MNLLRRSKNGKKKTKIKRQRRESPLQLKVAWRRWWWTRSSTSSPSGPYSSAVLLSTPRCHILLSSFFVNVYHDAAFEKHKNNSKKGTGRDKVWSEIYFKITGSLRMNYTWRAHSTKLVISNWTHGAGSLRQNSTGRDHWIRITRGGTTQSELHGAGSLNQNSTGRDHSIRIQRGGITQ